MGHGINYIITQSLAQPLLSHTLTYFYKPVKTIQNVINLLHRQNIFAAYKNQKINSHLKITQQ
jgi:membrane protein DedA with SNARE-associated domain